MTHQLTLDFDAPPSQQAEPDQVREDTSLPPPPELPPYSFAEFKELWKNGLSHGSFNAYQTDFERLYASHDQVIAELQSTYKAPQLKNIALRLGVYDAKSSTKQGNAESIYLRMLGSFVLDGGVSYGMRERYEDAVAAKIRSVTEDQWRLATEADQAAREEREHALANPESLEDFRLFVAKKGEAELTIDQLARWDALESEVTRNRRNASAPSSTVTRFESDEAYSTAFTIKEGFHEKRDCKLWIVQLGDRVEKDTYRELLVKAKQLGGWYSSFKRSDSGFQFTSEDAANRFTGLLTGDADREDILQDRKARREQSTAERLHELASEMLRRSDETIVSSNQSRQNTTRRVTIQAGVRGRAYAEAALARTMHSLAEALSKGEAHHLNGLRHRTHIEELDRALYLARWARLRAIQKAKDETEYGYGMRVSEEEEKPLGENDIRFAQYPYPVVYARNLWELVDRCKGVKGMKQLSARLAKRLPERGFASDFLTLKSEHSIDLVSEFIARAKGAGIDCGRVEDELAHYARLKRARIETVHELRSALREYLPHKATARGDDPVLVAERELIGKDLPGFFPTPAAVIEQMLEYADVEPGHQVLEPSCGKGDIVQAIEREHPQAAVTAIEMNRSLGEVLSAKGIEPEFGDFLEHRGQYDRVVMNPPFEKHADIAHVRHAYDCLKPGGRLVAVMPEGRFTATTGEPLRFQDWLESLGGVSYPLPERSFMGVEAFRQTGVSTRLVVLDKDFSAQVS